MRTNITHDFSANELTEADLQFVHGGQGVTNNGLVNINGLNVANAQVSNAITVPIAFLGGRVVSLNSASNTIFGGNIVVSSKKKEEEKEWC